MKYRSSVLHGQILGQRTLETSSVKGVTENHNFKHFFPLSSAYLS
jgi:hypothetical protein